MEFLHGEITREVIGAAFEVHRILGYGFLEKVYQRAMVIELTDRGLSIQSQRDVHVSYKGRSAGDYQPDLFVNQCVLVELKVAKAYNPEDEAQLLNVLKATGIKVGLLVNFGRKQVEFKRMVF